MEGAALHIGNALLTTDEDDLCLLILLDLSAAFDTVNHPILICILDSHIGITGNVLHLLSCYLSNLHQFVHMGTSTSQKIPITCGVSQGSILSSVIFNL